MKVKAGQVIFDEGQPVYIDIEHIISDNTENDTIRPILVVNQGTSSGDIFEAFTCYTHENSSYQVNLNVVSGSDVWSDPYDISNNVVSGESDITYQTFGTSRNIWIDTIGGKEIISTNTGIIDDFNRKTVGSKICTNQENKREIYCAYKQYLNDDQKIMIQQLEP